mmetsp:Transcript_4452/g.15631  ORF Transcript_4452/g.15631 Transcript_4452/m.15631 type:complete len:505 (+) Transcript_4452:482-1996(+)
MAEVYLARRCRLHLAAAAVEGEEDKVRLGRLVQQRPQAALRLRQAQAARRRLLQLLLRQLPGEGSAAEGDGLAALEVALGADAGGRAAHPPSADGAVEACAEDMALAGVCDELDEGLLVAALDLADELEGNGGPDDDALVLRSAPHLLSHLGEGDHCGSVAGNLLHLPPALVHDVDRLVPRAAPHVLPRRHYVLHRLSVRLNHRRYRPVDDVEGDDVVAGGEPEDACLLVVVHARDGLDLECGGRADGSLLAVACVEAGEVHTDGGAARPLGDEARAEGRMGRREAVVAVWLVVELVTWAECGVDESARECRVGNGMGVGPGRRLVRVSGMDPRYQLPSGEAIRVEELVKRRMGRRYARNGVAHLLHEREEELEVHVLRRRRSDHEAAVGSVQCCPELSLCAVAAVCLRRMSGLCLCIALALTLSQSLLRTLSLSALILSLALLTLWCRAHVTTRGRGRDRVGGGHCHGRDSGGEAAGALPADEWPEENDTVGSAAPHLIVNSV